MEAKICQACGVKLERPPRLSLMQWEARRACSPECGHDLRSIEARSKTIRTCTECKRPLAISEFRPRSDGRPLSYCKDCDVALSRERYARNGRNEKKRQRPWVPSEKHRARAKVNGQIRAGRLKRQPCMICGKDAEAHHPDYSKPLAIQWLCPKHHGEAHRKPLPPEVVAAAIRARKE